MNTSTALANAMANDVSLPPRRPRPPYIYAALLALIAIPFLWGGTQLALLGGSPYYVLTGIALVVIAVLLCLRRKAGAALYGFMLGATVFWAVWEVGFDVWALIPRLLGPILVGLWLLTPNLRRSLS